MFVLACAARPLDRAQIVLLPPIVVSVFDETPSKASKDSFAPELLFQILVCPGSFPSACFYVDVFQAHFSLL